MGGRLVPPVFRRMRRRLEPPRQSHLRPTMLRGCGDDRRARCPGARRQLSLRPVRRGWSARGSGAIAIEPGRRDRIPLRPLVYRRRFRPVSLPAFRRRAAAGVVLLAIALTRGGGAARAATLPDPADAPDRDFAASVEESLEIGQRSLSGHWPSSQRSISSVSRSESACNSRRSFGLLQCRRGRRGIGGRTETL